MSWRCRPGGLLSEAMTSYQYDTKECSDLGSKPVLWSCHSGIGMIPESFEVR